jgi:hypothetical protein
MNPLTPNDVLRRSAVSHLKIKIFNKHTREKRGAHQVTRHYTPIHNILSNAPQSSISQKALGTLPDDGNVMLKHVAATILN